MTLGTQGARGSEHGPGTGRTGGDDDASGPLRKRVDGQHGDAQDRRGGPLATVARVARDVAPALLVYAVVRLAGLIALAILGGNQGFDTWSYLHRYDGAWLLGIARHGYDPLVPVAVEGRSRLSNIAFFPLYPGVVRAVSAVSGVTLVTAGLVVTAVSGLAAAAGLDRFGRRLAGGRVAGLVLVALWASWPHSVVLSMTYSEALFVALVVWSLVALLDGRWLTAGVLALLAGATRPFGLALALAIAVAAVPAVYAALRSRNPGGAVRPVLATLIAPLGQLAYWAWQWRRTGRPDAWFHVQSTQWRSTYDGGAGTLEVLGRVTVEPMSIVLVVCLAVVVASVVLLVALVVDGAPLPVVVYSAAVVLVVFGGASYHTSKSRFLLAAFPLLLVVVRGLAGLRVRTLPVVLAGIVLVSSWYNAYVLLLSRSSP